MLFAIVLEQENISWLHRANIPIWRVVLYWAELQVVLAAIALAVAWLWSSSRNRNPWIGLVNVTKEFIGGVVEILTVFLGTRRILAIAKLAILESIRRKVLYVLIAFLIPFLFAGWYLPKTEDGQLVVLVAFVTSAMNYVFLPMVLVLTALSLPTAIKDRTIQTVVTKPVRRLEILLGLILGYMTVFTLVLGFMGGVSLLYLRSQVTPRVKQEQWTARVAVYGAQVDADLPPLYFVKNGAPKSVGTNVGKEWNYRSHIEGTDTAHWTFFVDPKIFADRPTVRCEFKFDIFKTTKGDPTRKDAEGAGVFANIEFKDRTTGQVIHKLYRRIENNRINVVDNIPVELFKNGKVEVVVQCITPEQFLGMAYPDLYFLARSESFELNFLKNLYGVWLKVLLLTCVAISASTILNGFVTVLFTLTVYVLGSFYDFMVKVVNQEVAGGGPVESAIRLWNQDNQLTLLDPTLFNRVAQTLDTGVLTLLDRVSLLTPNLNSINTTIFLAEGFNIDGEFLMRNTLIVLAYIIPAIVVGFYILRNREIAA